MPAAVLVALCAAAALAGISPAGESAPAAAAPALDAGIASVRSVSGVLIPDEPATDRPSYSQMKWTGFAATSAGDRRADVHYAVDWSRAAVAYRQALRELASRKAVLSPKEYAKQLDDLPMQYAVPTRSVWVQDSFTHTATWAMFSAHPVTRRLLRVKYVDLPYGTGLPPTPDHTDSWRVWELATQLRAALEQQPGLRVTSEPRDGAAGYHVDVPATGGAPAWSAYVDQATGLTLSVSRTASGDGSVRGVSSPYHVRDLRVNEPLGPYTFLVRPDYRKVPGLKGGPVVKTLDLVGDDLEDRWLPADRLESVAPPSELAPQRVPQGFELSEVHDFGPKSISASVGLVYRRGLGTLYSWSGLRHAEYAVSDEGDVTWPDRIRAFERTTWPILGGGLAEVTAIERLHGGALDGAPAALSASIGEPVRLEAWTSRDQTVLAGDITTSEALETAGTLEPREAGAWHRPLTGLAGLIALVAAAAVAAVTAWRWQKARRAAAPAGRPRLSLLTWPLAGVVVVVVGACLDWHALRNGLDFDLRGLQEPLGLWVVAAALAAVASAAAVQLARGVRSRWALKTAALFLSAAALAGSAFALVYLPVIARFVVDPGNGVDASREGWLLRVTASRMSPSAAAGLYVSIAGALLLFVGVLLLRRSTAETPVPADAGPQMLATTEAGPPAA